MPNLELLINQVYVLHAYIGHNVGQQHYLKELKKGFSQAESGDNSLCFSNANSNKYDRDR